MIKIKLKACTIVDNDLNLAWVVNFQPSYFIFGIESNASVSFYQTRVKTVINYCKKLKQIQSSPKISHNLKIALQNAL